MSQHIVRGRVLEVRLKDPPRCRDGHDFAWRPVQPVAFPDAAPGAAFGICRRCWRVKGANAALVRVAL